MRPRAPSCRTTGFSAPRPTKIPTVVEPARSRASCATSARERAAGLGDDREGPRRRRRGERAAPLLVAGRPGAGAGTPRSARRPGGWGKALAGGKLSAPWQFQCSACGSSRIGTVRSTANAKVEYVATLRSGGIVRLERDPSPLQGTSWLRLLVARRELAALGESSIRAMRNERDRFRSLIAELGVKATAGHLCSGSPEGPEGPTAPHCSPGMRYFVEDSPEIIGFRTSGGFCV